MKKIIVFVFCIISTGLNLNAQTEKAIPDTTISFKVYGLCEMCKERIETAAKGRGVKLAEWDLESKILTLQYIPSQANITKIQNRIVGAGHDLENKKAKEAVYRELPPCCLYRDSVEVEHGTVKSSPPSQIVRGIILEASNKGKFNPLFNASIIWMGSNKGVFTDSLGYFEIEHPGTETNLVVSYTGYKSDTIAVANASEIKVVMTNNRQLKEVIVTNTQRSSFVATMSTIRTETMTSKELLKAACCNLSESFETNPSVDVSYNDAVTGSKQIQLLGLSGNYTQLTIENLPGPRGIATPLGLNSIAGPWIESIQLTKGVGSVANGFESIAGQINVELKKPENSEKLLANIYMNDFGKTDLNLNLSTKLNKKWSTGLLLHDNFLNNNTIDFNKDGFRDLPTGNQFSVVNRYKFDNANGLLIQFGFKAMKDNKVGGQVAFNEAKDKNTTNNYGLGINTERYEGFAKIGYVFPQKVYKSIGLQIAAINHNQQSYFGLTNYNAKQQSFYSNLIYQSIIGTTIHKFRTGMSFQYDQYNEDFNQTNYQRTEIVPGGFFEYTYTPNEEFSAVAGIRIDHNNLFGTFVTPRLNLRYEPIKGTVFRFSAGRGQRTANIFAENMSVFVSARQVNIINALPGKGYGLNPEIAWNKGISLDQKFRLFNRDASFSIDFFRNDFNNQVVVDLENTRQVKFYNLVGKSYSNSFQAEITITPITKLETRIAYRYFDVNTTYSGQLLQRPFIANNRAFLNLDYALNKWKFNYTITYNGQKRIPNTSANPVNYQFEAASPAFINIGAQISKSFGKKNPMDFYIGAENITNFFQQNAIIAADQPFNNFFDASMVWGPITGRMFYAGWRFKIK
jgi:outer membrane receptor for ferrienterochelin and colicin